MEQIYECFFILPNEGNSTLFMLIYEIVYIRIAYISSTCILEDARLNELFFVIQEEFSLTIPVLLKFIC